MVSYFKCRASLSCGCVLIALFLSVLSLPHRRSFPPPPLRRPHESSYVGALREPVEKEDEEEDEEDDEEDDGESDSEVHGDMLAARQINGDSEAEDEVLGGGGQDDDDDDDDDNDDDEAASSGLGAGGGDVAAATADERPEVRRSDRAQRFQGAMVDSGRDGGVKRGRQVHGVHRR